MFKKFLVFLVSGLVAISVAGAQQAGSDANAPESGYQALQEKGYILFDPEAVQAKLLTAGFTIQSAQSSPDGAAHALATTVGQQVFIFGFSDCAEEGCLFLRAIHPIPTAAAGLSISTGMVNELNATTPLGHYVVERGGNVSVRHTVPAVPQCAERCLDSHLLLFLNSSKSAHEILQRIGRQKVASAEEKSATDASLAFAGFEVQKLDAQRVNSLLVSETPFSSEKGLNGVGQLTDFTQLSGFEAWRPDFQPLLQQDYDSKILNEVGEEN